MKNNTSIALDTNIFIYHLEKDPHFLSATEKIFQNLERKHLIATTSIISLIELLSYKMPIERASLLQESFLEAPSLTIYDVNQIIATEAARIRREYGFRLPDSIQLATALYAKTDVFITNDEKLKKFTELKVMLIGEI